MKKLFMVLCVVILFFGIVGCPSSDNPTTTFNKSNITSTSPASTTTVGTSDVIETEPSDQNPRGNPVPEPATLILLGSGLVGLAGVGRKKFFKKD